ncbi:ERF family protein [bacterium]|nr:ERF family protein [bacterium]MBR2387089.1 ERF family protein [bacterium]
MSQLQSKLIKIQSELTVGKSKHNSFGDFNYRSCEDILKAVKPYLSELSLLLLLTDEVIFIGEKHYIKATAKLTDGTDTIEVSALAREPGTPKPKMDDSQTTGSTSSYARKYALSGLFGLDDGNDSDTTNNGKKPKETKLITKVQIAELKKLGFSDERLEKMAKYYKVESIEQITFKQASEAIEKQKRAAAKKEGGSND